MKLERIFFLSSIIGILILIFLAQITAPIYSGKIESIKSYNNRIIIRVEDNPKELVLFGTNLIRLKKGDEIEFEGKRSTYRNQEQIIVNKIYLLKK